MMSSIGAVNNRQILYFNRAQVDNLSSSIPKSNWILYAGCDVDEGNVLEQLAKTALREAFYAFVEPAMPQVKLMMPSTWRLLTEELRKAKDVGILYTPMTTWHDDWEEGFWFATTVACHDTLIINTVVCVNLTERDYKTQLEKLVDKINNGWLPD